MQHLTEDELLDTFGMSDEEWAAYKKKKRAQWKAEQKHRLEENSKKFGGQELIDGGHKIDKENYTGNLIDPKE